MGGQLAALGSGLGGARDDLDRVRVRVRVGVEVIELKLG